jgi:chromosome partitioning protein
MKGGVGKTTLAFNLAWYAAWKANLRVLVVDLDPQSNLSQYFMGAQKYLEYLEAGKSTVVEVFEQFSAAKAGSGSPTPLEPSDVIHELRNWDDDSLLHLVPARLELAWTLKNPTEKSQLLPQFLSKVSDNYDLVLIDCAPTESILTTAAYRSSRYVAVPVRPEFLATIGLPLLARSLSEFKMMHQDQDLDMAGIVFNGLRRTNTPPEQTKSIADVSSLAATHGWPVFSEVAHHSDSYPAGSRQGDPIFMTNYARDYVKGEFNKVARKFLEAVGAI